MVKINLFLSLAFCSFFVLSTSPIQAEERTLVEMKQYILLLEKQQTSYERIVNDLDLKLQRLETYKNNLTSYNIQTKSLSEKEKSTLAEEQALNQQQQKLLKEWELKYQDVTTSLTSSTQNLDLLQAQIDEANIQYTTLSETHAKTVKSNTFWGIIYKVLIGVSFLLGGYVGLQV